MHTTSFAVKGLPSCHFTPSARRNVSCVLSSSHDQATARSGRIELRVFWPNAIQFIEITRERWTVLTLEGDQSSAMPKFTDSPLEEERFEPSVPLGRERPERSNEAVSVQITIAPSGGRSLAAARLCSPSLSSLRRAVRCTKHIYI